MLRAVILFALGAIAAATNAEGEAWLEAKRSEAGVVALPSGLLYKVLRDGTGEAHPTASTPCDCHYKGTLIDGTQFDSSYDRGSPTSFAPNQVISGWTEAMQLMVEGDKWEMYIPSDLAYGDRGSPPSIPGGSALVFTMEIIKIKGETVEAVSRACNLETKKNCTERDLKYVEKWSAKTAEERAKEVSRLGGMQTAKTKTDVVAWMHRRAKILASMQTANSEL